jgi:hypothetical protein
MRQIIESAALTLLLAASSSANAQVLKQEPLDGKMVPGSVLLVDDGTCGKGKIKQVTGGETDAMNPRPRIRKCTRRLEISRWSPALSQRRPRGRGAERA